MGRKAIIGFAFMACTTFLISLGIYKGTDLVALSTVIGAQALGIAALMYGYKAEYQNKAQPPAQ